MRNDAPRWTTSELRDLATLHSLQLTAGGSDDSVELGMVVVDGELFVRSFRGVASRWYRAAVESGDGRVICGGWTRGVTFAAADDEVAGIESAYASKYGGSAGLVGTAQARAATLQISPR